MANYLYNSAPSGAKWNGKCLNVSDDSDWFPTVDEYPEDGTIDLSGGVAGRYIDTGWIAPPDTEWTMSGIYNVVMGVSYDMYSIHYKGNQTCDIYLGSNTVPLALSESDKPYTPPIDTWKMYEEPPSIIIPDVTFDELDPFGDSSVLAFYKWEDDFIDSVGIYDATGAAGFTAGVDGQALSLVAQAVVTDVRIPVPESFTVSFWGRKTSTGTGQFYCSNRSTSNALQSEFLLGFGNAGTPLYTLIWSDGGTTSISSDTLLTSTVDQWDYITMTVNHDGSTGTVDWYINGQPDGTGTYTGTRPNGSAWTTIGAQYTNTAEITADIDSMHWFNRGIDATEALELYTGMGGV